MKFNIKEAAIHMKYMRNFCGKKLISKSCVILLY